MATPWITVVGIAGLALLYAIAPIVAGVFSHFRGKRTVQCPETGLVAEVEMDARHAALTAVPGPPGVRIAQCTLWPDRAGCAQKCLAQAVT